MNDKWEYKALRKAQKVFGVKATDLEDELNQLGAEGWEAFSYYFIADGTHIVWLKRRTN